MKLLALPLIAGTLLGAIALPSQGCEPAEPPDTLVYSRREDGRCEGVQGRTNITGSLDLISLTSTTGGNLGRNLHIRVPRRDANQPLFNLEETTSGYRLNNLRFSSQGNFYTYTLPTQPLSRIGIRSVDDLRAIAIIGQQRVFLPTLLNTPASGYRFVFYSVDRVRFLEAGIRRADRTYANWGTQSPGVGQKRFEWRQAQQVPSGRYEFYYTAEIEQFNRPPERISRTIAFWHDPNWLR